MAAIVDVDVLAQFDHLDQPDFCKRLKQYADLYYNGAAEEEKAETTSKRQKRETTTVLEPICDETWDALTEAYSAKFGTPFVDVGAEQRDGNHQRKVLLPRTMASQNKVKSDAEWSRFLDNLPGIRGQHQFVLTDKCDGVSAMLHYYQPFANGDTEVILTTRGDGCVGSDISHLLPSLQHRLPSPDTVLCAGLVAVRVELEMTHDDFKRFESIAQEKPSNARNTVAGIVNGKTFDPRAVRLISVFAYECVFKQLQSEHCQWDKLELLRRLGFATPRPALRNWLPQGAQDTFEWLLSETRGRTKGAQYAIDGMIVTSNAPLKQENSLHSFEWCFGASRDTHCKEATVRTGKPSNPTHSAAVKLPGERYVTNVTQITWSTSRFGKLSPTIHFETVQAAVAMSKATGKSGKRIMSNALKRGDTIMVRRAGDAIPEFLFKVSSGAGQGEWESPPSEPAWEWGESGMNIVLKEPHLCEAVHIARWLFFMETLGVKDVGEETVHKLYRHFVGDLAALLEADKKELTKINGFKDVLAGKVSSRIHAAIQNVSLATLMKASSLFGSGVGVSKLSDILDAVPDCITWPVSRDKQVIAKRIAEIEQVRGVKTLATTFVKCLPRFQSWIDGLPMIHVEVREATSQIAGSAPAAKMVVVFSGKRNKEAADRFIKLGGKVSTGGVTRNTSHLVMNAVGTNSIKEQDARAKNVSVLTMEQFVQLLDKMSQ